MIGDVWMDSSNRIHVGVPLIGIDSSNWIDVGDSYMGMGE